MASTPDLSFISRSGIIQFHDLYQAIRPNKDHIIWYQSFGSWYMFYPFLFFFFVICRGSFFVLVLLFAFLLASCFVLIYILFHSCLRLVVFCFLFLFCYLRSCSCSCHALVLVSCVFQTLCQKKICLNFVLDSITNSVWGQFGLLEEFRGWVDSWIYVPIFLLNKLPKLS